MKQLLLVSMALVPVLLGVWAASDPVPRRGLARLLASFVLFTLAYAGFVYFLH